MTLEIIQAEPPETELRTILHPFDFYDLALAFEDRGVAIKWERLLALDLEPVASCYGSTFYDQEQVFGLILAKLGHNLVETTYD